MADFYDINDKDIDGMLNYLRIFEPENATQEYAVEFLKFLKLGYRLTTIWIFATQKNPFLQGSLSSTEK